jgi:hypothetical protein
MKKVIIIIGLLLLLVIIMITNTYTSTPGYTTHAEAEAFNSPICYGYSLLLNREATYADHPGRSFCFGILLQ